MDTTEQKRACSDEGTPIKMKACSTLDVKTGHKYARDAAKFGQHKKTSTCGTCHYAAESILAGAMTAAALGTQCVCRPDTELPMPPTGRMRVPDDLGSCVAPGAPCLRARSYSVTMPTLARWRENFSRSPPASEVLSWVSKRQHAALMTDLSTQGSCQHSPYHRL